MSRLAVAPTSADRTLAIPAVDSADCCSARLRLTLAPIITDRILAIPVATRDIACHSFELHGSLCPSVSTDLRRFDTTVITVVVPLRCSLVANCERRAGL